MERDVFHLTGKHIKGEEIFSRAREGASPYQEVVKRASAFLGLGLFNLVQIFDPEVIILGGVAKQENGGWKLSKKNTRIDFSGHQPSLPAFGTI